MFTINKNSYTLQNERSQGQQEQISHQITRVIIILFSN